MAARPPWPLWLPELAEPRAAGGFPGVLADERLGPWYSGILLCSRTCQVSHKSMPVTRYWQSSSIERSEPWSSTIGGGDDSDPRESRVLDAALRDVGDWAKSVRG
jgi:hypothetical protein